MFGLTPEEEEQETGGSVADQLNAPVPQASPPPVAQAPGPEAPSPEPNVVKIDQPFNISAAPEPGAPSPLPTPVPGVPGLPAVAPYTPQAPPPIPTGRVVSPAEAANLGAQDANTAARVQTTQQGGEVSGAAAQTKADAAAADLARQQAHAAEVQRISDEATKRIAEREAQANADYQQFKNFQLKDPDAEKSFGRKLLEGIASAMGAYSSAINGGPNQALSIIQNATKENIDRQKAQQEKLFQVAQHSGKDVEAARQERDDAFKQLDLKHSALLDSSAAALRAQLAKIGIPQAQIDANTDVQKLEADALKLREGTLQSIRQDETSLAKADIEAAARRARHAAAVGQGRSDALAEFAARAGELSPGSPIPPDLAVLGSKAGLKPAQIATEVERYAKKGVSGGGAGGTGAGGMSNVVHDEKGNPIATVASGRNVQQVTTRDADYGRAASQVQAYLEDIKQNGARVFTPEAIKRRQALYENAKIAVATVSPLGKTDEAMKTEAASLGAPGTPTSVLGMAAGANPSAVAAKLEELRRQRQAYRNEAMTPLTPEERARATRGRGIGVPGDAPAPAAKAPSARGQDPRIGLAREAIADPRAPPAAKARALQILKSLKADGGDITL